MSAHKINFYLSASERLQSLFTQAQYLIQLQQTFRKIVPANLAESCQVAAIDQKILVIFVDNGAVAAKLKHLLPSLLKKLQHERIEVSGIKFEVQGSKPVNDKTLTRNVVLSTAAYGSLTQLAAGLEDSPLKDSIEKMLAHHRD